MSHLNPERLAALSDDTPTPVESAHLTTCDACSAELVAQRKLARMAAAAGPVTDGPISSFDALVPRLKAEGLIAAPARRVVVMKWTVRVAASLALVTGGVIAGRMSVKASPASEVAQVNPVNDGSSVANAQPISSFRTPDDAVKALSASQQTYQSAAAYLAAQDTTSHFIGLNENTYRARLTALDDIIAATRSALYQAPQDPVLNQYYQGTLSARQATLAQLRGVTPVAARKGSY
ncbi:MAG TPA: hypothetical protein VK989_18120 [Polyangia bacterium]|jgi:hypothetical protein|nr:hypothetical protein [Polyangia bacterium]